MQASGETSRKYWQSFLNTLAVAGESVPTANQAWAFGNTSEMADRLGDLVVRGIKTATASLVWTLEEGHEPYPAVGEYSIVLNGQGLPICIIQTTDLTVVPFIQVKEEHAYLEGEGDRSLEYWRRVHWEFFGEECKEIGRTPDEQMPIMCERFKLVYK
jgi:uncharacterized protein YhfF